MCPDIIVLIQTRLQATHSEYLCRSRSVFAHTGKSQTYSHLVRFREVRIRLGLLVPPGIHGPWVSFTGVTGSHR